MAENNNNNNNVEARCNEVKQLVLNCSMNDPTVLSIDGLLDALLVLHDVCCSTALRGERAIAEFLQYSNILFCLY
jgi:hypothetical protein